MRTITTIGVIMLIIGFLSSALGAFPLVDISASSAPIDEDTPFSTQLVEETSGKIGTMYSTIIEDIASFADNPDLALAQSRLDEMTVYAEDLATRTQLFANDLQQKLDVITTAPLAPTGLTAQANSGQVSLDWNDNVEPDMAFYNVYRSTTAGGPYSFYAAGVGTSTFVDAGVSSGTTYYYVVTAINTSEVESDSSNPASVTP
jgi:hypothetical protein